ncbi:hypothetical protein SASPL_105082 [Salvia splendens]|uniref:PLAT domain-containing protein n=1 Tax=Salvia splendens TaxID=180675 RepID=A0A8X9A9N1_SALSN|nr:hypothetical protein SASPL_105082 [Salvia splendens]
MFTCDEWMQNKLSKEAKGIEATKTVMKTSFWNNVVYILKIMGPLVRVLRMVDGEKKAAMGYIYEAREKTKEAIKKNKLSATDEFDPIILDDIDECNEWLVGELDDDDDDDDIDGGNHLVHDDDDTLDWNMVYKASGVGEPRTYTRSKKRKESSTSSSSCLRVSKKKEPIIPRKGKGKRKRLALVDEESEEEEFEDSVSGDQEDEDEMDADDSDDDELEDYPKELGIIRHQTDGESIQEMVDKRVSEEMFESIIREVVEEIGVPAATLLDMDKRVQDFMGKPIFIGISQRALNVRPTAFFFIKCSLKSEEIHKCYSSAEDSYESTQLYTMPMSDLARIMPKMPGCHQGGFALYKLMVDAVKENKQSL